MAVESYGHHAGSSRLVPERIQTEKSAKNVVIETTVEVIERSHGEKLIAALNGAGFPTRPV